MLLEDAQCNGSCGQIDKEFLISQGRYQFRPVRIIKTRAKVRWYVVVLDHGANEFFCVGDVLRQHVFVHGHYLCFSALSLSL